jgi:predicted secreted protein
MAFGAGKDAVFRLGNVGGVLTDISAFLTDVTAPSIDAQVTETSTLGDNWKEYTRTQIDPGEISCDGIYDPALGTMLHGLATASERAFEYHPQGTATGRIKFSGSALLSSMEMPANIDEAVTISFALQATGVVAVSANP